MTSRFEDIVDISMEDLMDGSIGNFSRMDTLTVEDLIAAKEAMDAVAVAMPAMMFTEQGMFYRDEKTGEWWNEDRTEKLIFGMERSNYE